MTMKSGTSLLAETLALAERVHVTQRHDRYAAAALAEACLYRIGDPLLETFVDEAERAQWIRVQNTLREAQRSARTHWRMASELDAYHDKFRSYTRLLEALDGDPQGHVHRHQRALRAARPQLPAVACALSAVLAMVALWFASSPLSYLGAGLLACSFVAAGMWLVGVQARTRDALHALRDARDRAQAYTAFMADPEGGQWLRLVWQRHPLLLEQAPRPAKPTSGVVRIQRGPQWPAALAR